MLTTPEIQTLRLLLPPHGVAFDVGAHHGEWTLHAIRQSPAIQVHAFEPSPATNRVLRAMLAAHIAAGRAIVSDQALGESAGVATFCYYAAAPGLSGFHRRAGTEAEHNIAPPTDLSVPVTTLADYCRDHSVDHIDLLKIDTEGHELSVLKGAADLLRAGSIECVQFEYGGTYRDAGITLREVFSLLMGFDYTLLRMEPTHLSHQPVFKANLEDYQFANYVALPSRRVTIR